MVCPDCKGTGTIQLLTSSAPCARCAPPIREGLVCVKSEAVTLEGGAAAQHFIFRRQSIESRPRHSGRPSNNRPETHDG
jgi:hypothetical protein